MSNAVNAERSEREGTVRTRRRIDEAPTTHPFCSTQVRAIAFGVISNAIAAP